jgi:hypothetical protein
MRIRIRCRIKGPMVENDRNDNDYGALFRRIDGVV